MNIDIDIDEIKLILSGVRILQDLEVDTIEDIANLVQTAKFSEGQNIVSHGQQGDRLYIIFNGRVEVRIATPGQTQRTIMLKKGSVVGEISLLTNKPYSADIVALTDTTALYLESKQFMQMIELHKSFAETMTNLMSDRMAENGDINQIGKYKLLDRLGEGNMAIVFNAYDSELEREVAIKMLKYELAYESDFLQRFEQEAKIIASLNHPHIVNVIEVINEFSTRFIVMEKLHGDNLWDILNDRGAFTLTEVRDILFQVSSALQYAHGQGDIGIVHRDIKPANIVIDRYGNIKLTDFGISGPPQDTSINIEGTPSYLAPEVINGELVDGRADIYALGVMAFQMLTESLPFTASTLAKLLTMQVQQQPPDIRNFCPDIDDDFADFINQSLEKDPEQRIADWEQIKKLLKPAVKHNSISLQANEMGVVIRLRDTSYQQSAKIINAIQKMLVDDEVNHTIEMQRGDQDS